MDQTQNNDKQTTSERISEIIERARIAVSKPGHYEILNLKMALEDYDRQEEAAAGSQKKWKFKE